MGIYLVKMIFLILYTPETKLSKQHISEHSDIAPRCNTDSALTFE